MPATLASDLERAAELALEQKAAATPTEAPSVPLSRQTEKDMLN